MGGIVRDIGAVAECIEGPGDHVHALVGLKAGASALTVMENRHPESSPAFPHKSSGTIELKGAPEGRGEISRWLASAASVTTGRGKIGSRTLKGCEDPRCRPPL
jgi:hypothetical protein